MPTRRARRREPCQIGPLAIVALAAAAVLVVTTGVAAGSHRDAPQPGQPSRADAWSGFVGDQRVQVAFGQRQIVVLRAPSLADRVARAGGRATESDERRWTREAFAAQRELISRLALQGIAIHPDFSYGRVLNGFAAALPPQASAILERMPEVAGLYPVRALYPASIGRGGLALTAASTGLARLSLPGLTGRGVTIALLDTGVDVVEPLLHGRVLRGYDVVDGEGPAVADSRPGDTTDFERHGTELAGLIVAKPGEGPHGVAPNSTILPLRVAGWQRDAAGQWAVYGRTDQLIAGLERAVDPNGDGDAHDAARIALLGVAEPFAAFASSPSARAVAGAARLDTLVVCPAGNNGPVGPAYGSIAGPGGSPAALTVGAADLRRVTAHVRVAVRAGLDVLADRALPLVGVVGPSGPTTLQAALPRRPASSRGPTIGPPSEREFYAPDGESLVAGRAALVSGLTAPGTAVENAAAAGAHAVLVYGGRVPAGALGLDEKVQVPVIGLPARVARAAIPMLRRGVPVTISIGPLELTPARAGGSVVQFSSRGLAFDGRVKPELVSPGVALPTTEPGTNEDGSPRIGTINGSSAAAAGLAAAAALLAQARPSLDAAALRSLLVGSARPLRGAPLVAQGAGLVDLGSAAASEIALSDPSLSFGEVAPGRRAQRALTIRNVSSRALTVRVRASSTSRAATVRVKPARLRIEPGRSGRAVLVLEARRRVRSATVVAGTVEAASGSAIAQRALWAVTVGHAPQSGLLGQVRLSQTRFRPSDSAPAVLFLRAGRVVLARGGAAIHPLKRLDVELWNDEGKKLGLLARLRDVLPGRYAFGLTGRGPAGQRLHKGSYRLRLVAAPTSGGPATHRTVAFQIE